MGKLSQGLLAGAIGGLVGSGAKALAELVYPPRTAGQTPPPIVLVRKVSGRRLTSQQEKAAMTAIHYTFGALAGAAYGVLAEYRPAATMARGAAFGCALNLTTHESTLPLMGLSDPPLRQTAREQLSEGVTHAVYGMVTELVRSVLRGKEIV